MGIVKLEAGDLVRMKKNHPCSKSAFDFRILTLGSDIKIKCIACGRETTVPRLKLEKNIKTVIHV